MAPHETLTDYEQRRLENIRHNGEMMASLLLQHKASDLSASLKRRRPFKTPKPDPDPDPDKKKNRSSPQSPVVIRCSLRARGFSPSGSAYPPPSERQQASPSSIPDRKQGPLPTRDPFVEGPSSSDRHLIGAILTASGNPQPDPAIKRGDGFDPRSSDKKNNKSSPQSPIVIRCSLRARGFSPSGSAYPPPSEPPQVSASPIPDRKQGPLLTRDPFVEGPSSSDRHLIGAILTASGNPQADPAIKRGDGVDPRSSDKKNNKSSPQSPIVIRCSLRARGFSPSGSAYPPPSEPPQASPSPIPDRKQGPLLTRDPFVEGPSSLDRHLIDAILTASGNPQADPAIKRGDGFDPRWSLVLRPDNVRKLLSDRIPCVVFFPFTDRMVVAAGNTFGHVGFWDVDSQEGNDVYVYSPHSAHLSGISIHPFSSTKMYTSSYDGFIRLMDVEKETFNMIYSSDNPIFSICQPPHDNNSLYLGEGSGELKVWDERAGKASSSCVLHGDRINTIDLNPGNANLMATSSTDRKACIWDLRSLGKSRPESIKTVQHYRAVHSAYFSPSGSCLATTSFDDRIGILSGANFNDLSMIRHRNQTGRWLSSFRAIWGWDDSYLFMGNIKKAVDVISTAGDKATTTALESPHMTSIPCRFAAHPFREGTLASSASGGKLYLWTKNS